MRFYTKHFISGVILLFSSLLLNAQNEMFSEDELSFKHGYDELLTGDPLKALKIFDDEIFENGNYNAVPYYKTAACGVSEKEAPNLKRISRAVGLAKKAKNDWGASLHKKPFERAHDLIVLKADNGNAVAQFILGSAFYYGSIIDKNPEMAFKYLRLAADQGLRCAQFAVGTCYADAIGVEQDYDKALMLIEASIEQYARKHQTNYLKKLKGKITKRDAEAK